ncbi:MAG: right-handed parallel beta-helix repeat-containing protein, partial [Lentisphaeria bacterium]|nr:right-handed parallel beta-helix repeat-containing protein [Lentisphaeria bacterium]
MPAPLLFPAQCTAASWASALADSRKHPGREREIRLAPGTLHLDQPICLGPEDQGLTISGSGSGGGSGGGGESGGSGSGGGTVISGAFPLTDWRPDGDGALAADLPDQTAPRLLLIGDDTKARPLLRPRARFPRQGWLTCLDHPAIAWQGSHGGGWNRPPHPYELTHMTINPDDWPQSVLPANAEVTLFHCWDESTIQVGAIDWSTGVVAFLTPTEHPAGAFGRNAYVLWNIREGLTDPGQWMHDRTRQKVVYRPFPDEDPDRLAARIARPESLFRLLPGADQVTLRDLGLTMTNAPAGSAGLRAVKPPGAVDACQCAGLTLTRLTITHAAGQGIRTCQCPGLAISQCRISNCGAGGITALESLPADIHDNDVTDVGKTCFSAVAITGGGKSELGFVQDGCVPENGVARIEGNRIEGAPYCGIVCNGGPHLVRNNRLTRVMQTLHDGAAIYASRAEHTVIAGNVIHDIVDDTNQKHALYFDEYSHHAVLDANLVLDCTSPVHAHRAWRCTISNNHFINTGPLHIDANACQNLTLTGNLIASRQDISLRSNAPQGLILKDDNRLFSASDAISCQNNHDCQPHFFYENDRVAMVQMPETGNPARRWRRLAVFGDSITQTGAFAAELMLHLACRFPEQYT